MTIKYYKIFYESSKITCIIIIKLVKYGEYIYIPFHNNKYRTIKAFSNQFMELYMYIK